MQIKHTSNGYVYAITGNGMVKVGKSIQPKKRINGILTSSGVNPNESERAVFHTGEHSLVESVVLSELRCKFNNPSGEWFKCELVDAVEVIKKHLLPLEVKNDDEIHAHEMTKALAMEDTKRIIGFVGSCVAMSESIHMVMTLEKLSECGLHGEAGALMDTMGSKRLLEVIPLMKENASLIAMGYNLDCRLNKLRDYKVRITI